MKLYKFENRHLLGKLNILIDKLVGNIDPTEIGSFTLPQAFAELQNNNNRVALVDAKRHWRKFKQDIELIEKELLRIETEINLKKKK